MAETTVQPQDPAAPVVHVASHGVTFDQPGTPPLSERCVNPPKDPAALEEFLTEWQGLYDNGYASSSHCRLYADYFLRLLNTLRSEAVVTQLTTYYFREHRPHGLFRRHYDALDFAQTEAFINRILSDLPTSQFPQPHEMAKAFQAFEFILREFRFHPLVPAIPNGGKFFRGNEAQAIDWLRRLHTTHLPTNFNG